MRSSLRAAVLSLLFLGMVGCGSHGFLGTDYNPKGDITITNPMSGAVITSSETDPYPVTSSAFSIGIAETNFSGPYMVTVINQHNGFNIPCFVPHLVDSTDHVNVVLFSSDNANPPTDPITQANPCVFGDGDIETALINDGKGHSVYFYYELDSAQQAGAAAARRL